MGKLGKYIDDAVARSALETAAQHADKAGRPTPFVWTGADWTTPGGERRDLPLIRRGMGEWLRDLGAGLHAAHAEAVDARARWKYLMDQMRELRIQANAATDPGAKEYLNEAADELARDASYIHIPAAPIDPDVVPVIGSVASEILSAPNSRATQLLSLASQFESFRAPMRDPGEWVKRLAAAPRSVHVRTTAVWDAFCVAEPVLARSLGATAGKRALFAAMDRRFGARRKLAGYEGWRGVALGE
ncbi:hypothetical protein AC230_28115 [Streptomyces caatingaensis]|uniref:Uncharacterized protein n=1 Tax=Streptomyces caatingaensis TaxID=1678637 RepID=A0A0K9X6Y5_9ACTN|nr:hypothetical protein AC230_28115 [Streptomyces caatingaensis]